MHKVLKKIKSELPDYYTPSTDHSNSRNHSHLTANKFDNKMQQPKFYYSNPQHKVPKPDIYSSSHLNTSKLLTLMDDLQT